MFPHTKQQPQQFASSFIMAGASIEGATILLGITIGAQAMAGTAAVVTRTVPDGVIIVGNPPRIVGYGAKHDYAAGNCVSDHRGIVDMHSVTNTYPAANNESV